jgi:hypothetical protein
VRQWRKLAAGLLAVAAAATSMACPAQQHRQIDAASGHAARSAPAAIGGPKTAGASGGPRFPLVPVGSLNTTLPAAAAHRPAAKPNLAASAGHLNAASHLSPAATPPSAPPATAAHVTAANTAAKPAASSTAGKGAANPAPANTAPAPALVPQE